QDGPYFALRPGDDVEVIARYRNGLTAAAICQRGDGVVCVVGPHPEATDDWYLDAHLSPPLLPATDLAAAIVEAALSRLRVVDAPPTTGPCP
ncbi:MAG TPA: hypothetical protein VES02_14390, partial [Dermatophilaceae bacterium]|nr:hypothetical protein [Dermatophilaceae bacterium]